MYIINNKIINNIYIYLFYINIKVYIYYIVLKII